METSVSKEKAPRDARGRLQKGHPGLKPKGSFHKISGDIRDRLSIFLLERSDEFAELWKKLNERDKVRLFVDICAFVVPKQKDIAITVMNEPTRDAVARLFDFNDEEDRQLWIEHTKQHTIE